MSKKLLLGEIEVIMGPMCGGKTTELKRRIEVYHRKNKKDRDKKHNWFMMSKPVW